MKTPKMRRPQLLISAAWLVHVLAWFLPVVKGGGTFPNALPGWQAFRLAACAVWPIRDVSFEEWYVAVLSTISAGTTVLFVLCSALVVARGSRALRRVSAWIAAFSFVVNSHWFLLFGSDRKDLRIGYFLWWSSFLLVALGLFDLSRSHSDNLTSQ